MIFRSLKERALAESLLPSQEQEIRFNRRTGDTGSVPLSALLKRELYTPNVSLYPFSNACSRL